MVGGRHVGSAPEHLDNDSPSIFKLLLTTPRATIVLFTYRFRDSGETYCGLLYHDSVGS